METPKTFRIDRGIGQYDFNDYYAVLGLPLTAEASHVRKQYLSIAKCLHPDIYGRSHSEKQVATQYLSKLVNPAYNVLSQERERTEYSAILKLLGKRLMKRNQKFAPQSDLAKKYLTCTETINYEQTIREIAKVQYHDLENALENIALLSELNLVHILLKEGYKHVLSNPIANSSSYTSPPKSSSDDTTIQVGNTGLNRDSSTYRNSAGNSYQMRSESQAPLRNTAAKAPNQASNPNNNSSLNQCIYQAESYINQQLWALALKELRNAIQVDCNSSKCHALLGFVYMNQKLSGMAKVSFQQALKLNPDEPIAKQYIEQVTGTNSSTSKTEPKNDKKGGFFGWLGGG